MNSNAISKILKEKIENASKTDEPKNSNHERSWTENKSYRSVGRQIKHESLILAQDERWRRA